MISRLPPSNCAKWRKKRNLNHRRPSPKSGKIISFATERREEICPAPPSPAARNVLPNPFPAPHIQLGAATGGGPSFPPSAFMTIADLRREYNLGGLRRSDLAADPIAQFNKWFEQARSACARIRDPELLDPTAMTLATAD